MIQKRYVNIERVKEKYANKFVVGEPVIIQVKIDGSNSSIAYDKETDSLIASKV